jgi:hypothetical protein
MRHRSSCERRCSYLVVLENGSGSTEALCELAAYLSEIAVSNIEVIIVDASTEAAAVEENRRVLRWVGRHVIARPQHFAGNGKLDAVRAAADLAACEKIIVADARVRYGQAALDETIELLELHEVVEPQDYVDPLPWWGSVEAGRILVHRSLSPLPDHGATLGFRKRIGRGLRPLEHGALDAGCARRLAAQGAEVFHAMRVFVRRVPPAFSDWMRTLPRRAEEEFAMPVRAAMFFTMIPSLIAITLLGGLRLAAACAGTAAFASILLALRGRIGAGRFFPWRACIFAPLWILQRAVAIYFALLRRAGGIGEPRRVPVTLSDRSPSARRAAD